VLPGQVMDPDGFQLSVTLTEVHLPRMWVEKHPDKESQVGLAFPPPLTVAHLPQPFSLLQACMLVFYPDFDFGSGSGHDEVVLLLDTSESMRGESLRSAQRIALQVLRKLDNNLKVNVILFGTGRFHVIYKEETVCEHRSMDQNFFSFVFS